MNQRQEAISKWMLENGRGRTPTPKQFDIGGLDWKDSAFTTKGKPMASYAEAGRKAKRLIKLIGRKKYLTLRDNRDILDV